MTVDEWRTYRRPTSPAVDVLEWTPADSALMGWPEYDVDESAFSADLSVTQQDVYASLGPQAEEMLHDLDVDVDELIRLINAETTMLPVIPDVAPLPLRPQRSAGPQHAKPETELDLITQRWKKRFLKGAVMAALVSMAGGGVAVAMNKSVTVNVDGKQQVVNTYGSTVGDVLDEAGIKVGSHDALSPAPSAAIGDDGVIKLERGRQLAVVVDGERQDNWVRATTVDEALRQLGKDSMVARGAWVSQPGEAKVPVNGMTLEIKTLKQVELFDGGERAKKITTHAVTVSEFLSMEKLKLGPQDEVVKGPDRRVVDGAQIHINRTGTSVVKIKEPIEAPVREISDDSLEQGTTKVIKAGKDGQRLVTYRLTKRNNVEVNRDELASKVLRKPKERVVRVGTKSTLPNIGDAEVWDRLAECESSGNWAINTGNGYYGGLQFDKSTWDAYGGDAYSAYPHEASREQQIDIAEKVRDDRGGYGAWPACSAKLGLPQ